MPHILIEYPADMVDGGQVEVLLDAVHRSVAASGLFDASHIRLRALPLNHYRLGGERAPFLHAQLRIHHGRTPEQKQQLSQTVLAALRAQQWPLNVITVEIVEMERGSYSKHCE